MIALWTRKHFCLLVPIRASGQGDLLPRVPVGPQLLAAGWGFWEVKSLAPFPLGGNL